MPIPILRRLLVLAATLVSLPLACFATAALVHVVFSLSTEAWYRQLFAGYGAKLVVEYALFVAGLAAIAALALRMPPLGAGAARVARLIAFVGMLAAGAIEFTFHDDLADHALHGVIVLPFVLWSAVLWCGRPRAPAGRA